MTYPYPEKIFLNFPVLALFFWYDLVISSRVLSTHSLIHFFVFPIPTLIDHLNHLFVLLNKCSRLLVCHNVLKLDVYNNNHWNKEKKPLSNMNLLLRSILSFMNNLFKLFWSTLIDSCEVFKSSHSCSNNNKISLFFTQFRLLKTRKNNIRGK